MDPLTIDEIWEREAYAGTGEHMGRIEAVGMGRDRVPRRVGVRSSGGRPLRFFALAGARLDDGRVILALMDPSLWVLSGDFDVAR